jgi:hypothetical protein
MRRLAFLFLAAASLSACDPSDLGRGVETVSNVPASPSVVAGATKADETTLRAFELSYKGARLAAEIAVDAGLLKGDGAARVQTLNRRGYEALLALRSAYRTANAESWAEAAERLSDTVALLVALAASARK